MEEFPNIQPGQIARNWYGKEVFYYAYPTVSLLKCIEPASENIKRDLDNDKIINLLLYVKQDDTIKVYGVEKIEKLLE